MLDVESLLDLRQLIPCYLLIATTFLSISCAITLFIPYSICTVIPALTTYGKTAEQLETYTFINSISVPKKWFKHFYIIGTINLLFWVHTIYSIFYRNEAAPDFLKYLTTLTKTQEEPAIPFSTSLLCLSLILFHVTRRLYETLFVSVYSDSRMNLFHYAVGIIHYTILPLSIICETQGLVSGTKKSDTPQFIKFNFLEITVQQWIGALIFSFCNWQQHVLAEKIANTRKGPRGLIRNYAYGICFGGWFNYVSCPHFLFEILIYLSLLMVVPTAYSYRFVVLFVCVNQTFAAEITHKWYQKTFPKYPAKRKALIPYIL